MTESIEYLNCPICGQRHYIDKYGWIDSCIGYYDKINWNYIVAKYYGEVR